MALRPIPIPALPGPTTGPGVATSVSGPRSGAIQWRLTVERMNATTGKVYIEVYATQPNPARTLNALLGDTGLRVATDWRSKDLVVVLPTGPARRRGKRVPITVGVPLGVLFAEPSPGAWPPLQQPTAGNVPPAIGIGLPEPDPEPAPEPAPLAPTPDPGIVPYRYQPSALLRATADALRRILASGRTADLPNVLLRGPSGTGKSTGAEWLAAELALPYCKVDAASVVEPTDWYGTRELVADAAGGTRTIVQSSAFVGAIQRRGLLFIDEINRTAASRNLNPLLGLLDTTHSVTDPLTGQPLRRHPECLIVMAANIGFGYIATEALDPALTSRAIHVPFATPDRPAEYTIVRSVSQCDHTTADRLTRFAEDARDRATNPDAGLPAISTRDLIKAATLTAHGMSLADAFQLAVLQANDNDGPDSPGARLALLWAAQGGAA